MTEHAAKALAVTLGGDALYPMPSTRTWGVTLQRKNGRFVAIEDHAGWVYRDRAAFDAFHRDGDQEGLVRACEWTVWDDGEEWARGLSVTLGSEEYWHSGGGIWL